MDLHQAGNQADWQEVPAGRRNAWQRLAARSGGYVTPSNLISVLGFLTVPLALYLLAARREYLSAVIVLALGRGCDLLDGWTAQRTGTKSPLGEKLDAGLDKLSTLLILAGAASLRLVPVWAIVMLLAPHIFIALVALAAWRGGEVLHPSLAGKLSMAAGWLSLLAFISVHACEGGLKTLTKLAAYVLLAGSVILATAAIAGYTREYSRRGKNV